MRIDINQVNLILEDVAVEHILPFFRNLKPEDISYKIGDDPVTIADQRAEKSLSARLLDLLPGSKVVGEEAFAADSRVSESFFGESPVWIIDPIDGTRNFTRGSSEFGVIVSLAEQNQIVAGWIYDPTSKQAVIAEKGAGAWFKGKKLQVLPPADLQNSRGILSYKLFQDYENSNFVNEMGPFVKLTNSSSHDYPQLIINGPHFNTNAPQHHFRAGYNQTAPWDAAAGILMHQEAGGYSAYWDGEPYRPLRMDCGIALAPDKDSWQQLRKWVQRVSKLPIGEPVP